eukprot:CAMPEP_0177596418 /NCGR_PEP_ID=MMETSP0419_2-20121207/11048_1 /TAXON_ID=582737 /ORGANISM="Tetraselmis sp., Strain GSL018" /LENGTH=140 /DNA_ID=CAMNT_0019088281 /DNA_START=812 /DNA_END=1234 /DNA_ORIENTATION=+
MAKSITEAFELKEEIAGESIGAVMSTRPLTALLSTPVSELPNLFENISGLPVINQDGKLVGVVTKKDLEKAKDSEGTVRQIMSTPPVAAKPGYKVSDAAAIMLKYGIHRLPIVDDDKRVVGIVTRTDISKALKSKEAISA